MAVGPSERKMLCMTALASFGNKTIEVWYSKQKPGYIYMNNHCKIGKTSGQV
jgi:hypothetical protein